jgi:hypothetical protein
MYFIELIIDKLDKIKSDKYSDRTEDIYSLEESYAEVTKSNNNWYIDYIESHI